MSCAFRAGYGSGSLKERKCGELHARYADNVDESERCVRGSGIDSDQHPIAKTFRDTRRRLA
jgi:hypothetical protein